jgi:protein-tyrosine-phosphatase
VEVPLSEINDTKDLKDVLFTGVYEKFSLYIPNKTPNSEFRGSRLGESDYSGSHGLFDALDEVISSMVQEYRDGRIKNFWPSNLLNVDPTTGMQYIPPAFKKDFITYQSGIGEREHPEVPMQVQGDIHSEKYIETYKKLIETILNNAGFSPQSAGITGLESTSASEESQELREKTSIRTREKKLKIWTPALDHLFYLLLVMDDIYKDSPVGEYVVKTVFNDYKIQTVDDKTRIASAGIQAKTWDIKTAVEYIHDDLTPEEQILMAVRIKIENGINIFTKEEELVYKKFVQETLDEVTDTPVVEDEPVEEEATDQDDEVDDQA